MWVSLFLSVRTQKFQSSIFLSFKLSHTPAHTHAQMYCIYVCVWMHNVYDQNIYRTDTHCIQNHRWKFVYLTLASIFKAFTAAAATTTREKNFFFSSLLLFPLFVSFSLFFVCLISFSFLKLSNWTPFPLIALPLGYIERMAISINYPSKLGFVLRQRHNGNQAHTA